MNMHYFPAFHCIEIAIKTEIVLFFYLETPQIT
jgi:hypothetical protein